MDKTHHRDGAVEISEGGIAKAICKRIGATYGA
jgi:hypothetical protein